MMKNKKTIAGGMAIKKYGMGFRHLCVGLLMLVSLPGVAAWHQPELSHNLSKIKTPYVAPAFELQNMDEEKVHLSDYKGKVVLINFWATWCPPCVREMPSMERLYRKFKDRPFAVLALNQMEDEDQVFAFTGQLEIDPTFTLLFDRDSRVANQYGIRGLPTTYLIDKKGMVRYRAIGGRLLDHPQVIKIVQQLMDE